MGRKFLFLIMTLLVLLSINTFGQERVIFSGKVVDFVTYQPLENTCIHNLSSGLMVFSNSAGDFFMMVASHDTLAISRVGYDMELFKMSDSLKNQQGKTTIKLLMKSIMLRNVVIYAMKPYPLFIKELVKTTPQEKMDVPGMEITPAEKSNYDANKGNMNLVRGTPLEHPISFLYDRFSRKAKMDRMYADLVSNQDEVLRLAQKYNPEIVHRITKLEGEKLDDFMLYCSFTYYTLITSSDLEIEQMIASKFSQYKRENGL